MVMRQAGSTGQAGRWGTDRVGDVEAGKVGYDGNGGRGFRAMKVLTEGVKPLLRGSFSRMEQSSTRGRVGPNGYLCG